MKIDVECMEVDVLAGAENTIKKHLPIIFIETFKENYNQVNTFLEQLEYKKVKDYRFSNYLYIPISKK